MKNRNRRTKMKTVKRKNRQETEYNLVEVFLSLDIDAKGKTA